MTERCPWTETLGAYLLGGLDDRERLAMRAHLDGCARCSVELDELKPVAHLLQTVDVERVLDTPEPPPALGAAVLASARRTERRQRWVRAGAFVAAAAVLLVALGFVRTGDDDGNRPAGQRVQLIGSTGVDAWVELQSVRAGTYAVFHMKGLPPDTVYRLWFEDAAGGRVALGTFRGVADTWLVCPTTTAHTVAELTAVGASDDTGTTVLRARLTPAGSAAGSGGGSTAPPAEPTTLDYVH